MYRAPLSPVRHLGVQKSPGLVAAAGAGASCPGIDCHDPEPARGETGPYKKTAELYDIESGTWTTTGSMANARNEAESAIVLGNGLVFVSGGHFAPNMQGDTAELYNPKIGSWSSAGTLSNKRAGHTSTLLRNGSLLIAGGLNMEEAAPTAALTSTSQASLTEIHRGRPAMASLPR